MFTTGLFNDQCNVYADLKANCITRFKYTHYVSIDNLEDDLGQTMIKDSMALLDANHS